MLGEIEYGNDDFNIIKKKENNIILTTNKEINDKFLRGDLIYVVNTSNKEKLMREILFKFHFKNYPSAVTFLKVRNIHPYKNYNEKDMVEYYRTRPKYIEHEENTNGVTAFILVEPEDRALDMYRKKGRINRNIPIKDIIDTYIC